jgi:hypothetical protein
MKNDDVMAADAAWFKKHRQAEQYVRHAFDVEREHAIAADPSYSTGPIVVLVIERHKQAYLASNNTWAPALQKLLANRGLSFAAYVQQQQRGDETITDALVRVLDGIETKTQQEESAPWE